MLTGRRIRFSKYIVPIAAAVAAALLLVAVRGILLPFVLALLMAHMAAPAIRFLQSLGLRRGASVVLLYLLLASAVAGAAVYGYLRLSAKEKPLGTLQASIVQRMDAGHFQLPPRCNRLSKWLDKGWERAKSWLEAQWPGLTERFLRFGFMLALAPVISFLFMMAAPRLLNRLLDACPAQNVEKVLHLLWSLDESVGRYLRALLLQSLLVGVLVFAGLFPVLPSFFTVWLAAFAGLANMVPLFGPLTWAAAAAIAASAQGDAWTVALVLAVGAAVKLIDMVLLRPRLYKQAVPLSPLLLLFAVCCGYELGGLAGMFLAVPIAIGVRILAETGLKWYRLEYGLRSATGAPAA